MLTSEMAVLKSRHGISVKCSPYRDTGTTDPSLPIQEQSRKYLRFHIKGRAYQFKALPFGLPRVPLEFTVIPKEVKLMAIHKDLRIHQYLDDWLVRARSLQACLQHTQELVNNVSVTGLADELREIRAGAQTRLRFCRLPVRPQVGGRTFKRLW